MTITFLGTGTSQGVPVIGCGCAVCRSADHMDKRLRSSILINVLGKNIVVDTGPDFRYQMLRQEVRTLDAILLTHEHKDHIAGLDDVRAFNYRLATPMEVYAAPRVQEALKREFYYAFSDNKYPGVPDINLHDVGKNDFFVGDVRIIPIEVMHYRLPVTAFRIGDFTYITDAKTISEAEAEKVKGSRVLVVNALQKGSHISHFTLDEAIAFAKEINAERTYFTHISHNLGTYEEVSKELPKGIELAYDGLSLKIEDSLKN